MDHQLPEESLGRIVDLSRVGTHQPDLADISGVISISDTHHTHAGVGGDQGATDQVRLEDEQSEYNRNDQPHFEEAQQDRASGIRGLSHTGGDSPTGLLNDTAQFESSNPGRQAKEPLHQFEVSSEAIPPQASSPNVQELKDRVAKKAKSRLQHQAASLQEVYSSQPSQKKRHVITEASEAKLETSPTILEEVLRASGASLYKNAPAGFSQRTPAAKVSQKTGGGHKRKSVNSDRRSEAADLKKSDKGSIKQGSAKAEGFTSSNTPEWLYRDKVATKEEVEALLRLGDNVTEAVLADALHKLKTDLEKIEGGAVSPTENSPRKSPRTSLYASAVQVEEAEKTEATLRKELDNLLQMQTDLGKVGDEDRETILKNTKELDRLAAKVAADKKQTEKNGGIRLETPQEKSLKAKVTELKNKNNELVNRRTELIGYLALDAEGELNLVDPAYLGYREQLNANAKHNALTEAFVKKLSALENQIETKSKGLEYVEGNIMRDRHYVLEKLQEKRVALQSTENELKELFHSVKVQEQEKVKALNAVPQADPLIFERNPEGKQYRFEVPGPDKGKVFEEDMSQFLNESKGSFSPHAGDFQVTFGSPGEKSLKELVGNPSSSLKKAKSGKPTLTESKVKSNVAKPISKPSTIPPTASDYFKQKSSRGATAVGATK